MLYDRTIKKLLFKMDPENAHDLALFLISQAGSYRLTRDWLSEKTRIIDRRLIQKAFGINFPNPVGLAAGFDKDGVAWPGLEALGFGFLELGTITTFPQPGNEKPRIFRLPDDKALINRMGFNNAGAEAFYEEMFRHFRRGHKPRVPIGISLGKSKITEMKKAVDDYLFSLEIVYEYGDYFVVNVSSPNTPNLRELQDKLHLTELVGVLKDKAAHLSEQGLKKYKPILVKIAPDLSFSQIDQVLEVCREKSVDGIIAVNTTVSRGKLKPGFYENGGLSGRPLTETALEIVSHISRQTAGQLPIIGVGGIFDAVDAFNMFKAGASLIQIYTGFVYGGPMAAYKINKGLLELMEIHQIGHISEIKNLEGNYVRNQEC